MVCFIGPKRPYCCALRPALTNVVFIMSQTKCRYHVRVLVPCYKEPLEITARTVQAAYNARLPAGCDLTIYLCDDGKDPQKRKWCASSGALLHRVLGRLLRSGITGVKNGALPANPSCTFPQCSL